MNEYNIINCSKEGKIFYPREAGFTKEQVIDMINERLERGELDLINGPVTVRNLTDGMMHQFVTDWHEYTLQAACGEFGSESSAAAQEDQIAELAQRLDSK